MEMALPDKITSKATPKRVTLAMHVEMSAICLATKLFLNFELIMGTAIAGRKAINPMENRVSSVSFWPRQKQKIICFTLIAIKQ
jgi:hypothetical protein